FQMHSLLLIGIISLQYAISAPHFLLPHPPSSSSSSSSLASHLRSLAMRMDGSEWIDHMMEGEERAKGRPDIIRSLKEIEIIGGGGRPSAIESQVDLDGDGALSLAEVQYAAFVHHGLSGSVVKQLFEEVDVEHDGFLSLNEFDNIRPLVLARAENAAAHYMKTIDDDGDGKLSLERGTEVHSEGVRYRI
ncbi:hypothetical protein PENTCL1PPCAC_11354, partial [Pristionchus entomophagus]